MRDHAVATAFRHSLAASALKIRNVDRETRWRCRLKVLWTGMHVKETLGGSSRFEALHLALSSPYRLMRVLRPVVLPKPLFVRARQSKAPERRGVGAQLIGHQQFRCKPLLSEKLAHQPQCRPAVAAALHQHVQDLALVVDGTPEIHPLAGDADHHFIQVPSVAWARTAPP